MSTLAKLSETAVSLIDSSDILYLNVHAIGQKFVQMFTKMRLWLGLCPRPRWRSYNGSPSDPLAGILPAVIPPTPRGLDANTERVG